MPVEIKLNWSANVASEFVSKYEVFQSKDGAAFAKVGESATLTFSVLNPLPGVYRYQVRAVNFVGNGPFSEIVSGPAAPSAVLDVVLTVIQS